MGSDPLNGQELATRGTITYQLHDYETTLRGYNILVGTVEQGRDRENQQIVNFFKNVLRLVSAI